MKRSVRSKILVKIRTNTMRRLRFSRSRWWRSDLMCAGFAMVNKGELTDGVVVSSSFRMNLSQHIICDDAVSPPKCGAPTFRSWSSSCLAPFPNSCLFWMISLELDAAASVRRVYEQASHTLPSGFPISLTEAIKEHTGMRTIGVV